MLYNYIKIAIRTIQRDKFFSMINTLGLAAIIGISTSHFAFDSWLAEFAFAASVSHWVYVLPVLDILLVSMLIIGIQTVKTAMATLWILLDMNY